MDINIRPGRPDDLDHISKWTAGTFEWGDYVSEQFLGWLDDPRGLVSVAVDDRGRAIALSRVVMLSANEAWFHAARVHPEHRRQGIISALHDRGTGWAIERGAMVARLMVEDWNHPARASVTRSGFREVVPWISAVSDAIPHADVPEGMALTRAGRAEVSAAWISWSAGVLARSARGLYSMGWYLRTMTAGDVEGMADRGRLYQGPTGWVEAVERRDTLWIPWIVTTEEDAPAMVSAITDLASRRPAVSALRLMFPAVSWMKSAALAAGLHLEPMSVFERPTRASER